MTRKVQQLRQELGLPRGQNLRVLLEDREKEVRALSLQVEELHARKRQLKYGRKSLV
jgi:hypothetical protein